MDRPERSDLPDRPEYTSIFSRPDRELEDGRAAPLRGEAPAADESAPAERPAWHGPIRPPEDPLYPHRAPGGEGQDDGGGPSRRTLVALGGGGVLIMLLAGFIGFSLLDGDQVAALDEPSPTPETSTSPSASAEPSASPTASPTATARPFAPMPLAAGEWATVTIDVVNVRSSAGLNAPLVGAAGLGEIVFVLDDDAEQADGLTWYRAVTAPGVAGWMAAHSTAEQNITPDDPTTSVRWCAVPDRGAWVIQEVQTGPTFVPPALGEVALIGGLPISTELLGAGGSGIVELAWGTQDQVCLDLAITGGRTSAVHLSAEIDGCGHPQFYNDPVTAVFGTGAVSSNGVADSRTVVLADTVLGYDAINASSRANLGDVLMMAANGPTGETIGEVCFTGSASGPASAASIDLLGVTTQCVRIRDLSEVGVTLENGWAADLRLTEGSFVGSGVRTNLTLRGYAISAEAGLDGPVAISLRDLPGC